MDGKTAPPARRTKRFPPRVRRAYWRFRSMKGCDSGVKPIGSAPRLSVPLGRQNAIEIWGEDKPGRVVVVGTSVGCVRGLFGIKGVGGV